jgi:DNA-binding CsgD family transcriptional regulator
MSQQEAGDSHISKWLEGSSPVDGDHEIVRLSAARTRATDEPEVALARQLNGPLTALLLYMGEIKQHSHQLSPAAGNKAYLQQVIDNALKQTERVCAMVKEIADARGCPSVAYVPKEKRSGNGKDIRVPGVTFASSAGQKPLTKREREVLSLISEGCSNKQGALRMRISPRTFESHRAEAMRKLGARNTAELVRTALLHPGAV